MKNRDIKKALEENSMCIKINGTDLSGRAVREKGKMFIFTPQEDYTLGLAVDDKCTVQLPNEPGHCSATVVKSYIRSAYGKPEQRVLILANLEDTKPIKVKKEIVSPKKEIVSPKKDEGSEDKDPAPKKKIKKSKKKKGSK